MAEGQGNPVLTPEQFAQKIKEKYPQYANVDNMTLAQKMVEKYPEYKSQVDFTVKKKEPATSTSTTPRENTESATKAGFSGFKPLSERKEPSYGVPKSYDELNPQVAERKKLEKELSGVKVTPQNMRDVSDKTNKLSRLKQSEKAAQDYLLKDRLNIYRQAVQVTDQDIQDANAELENLKNQSGIINNVKAAAGQLSNYLTTGTFKKDNPLQSEIEQAKAELSKEGKSLNEEELQKAAENIFVQKQLDNKRISRANEVMSSLSPEMRRRLGADADSRYKTISKETKAVSDRINMNVHALHDLQDSLDDPNLLPQDRANIDASISQLAKEIDKDYRQYLEDDKKLGSVEEEIDVFKRNYDAIDNFASRVATSLSDAGIDLASGANFLSPLFGVGQNQEQKQEMLNSLKTKVSNFREGFRPDEQDISAENWGRYVSDLLANQTGTIAQLIAAGETGGATLLGTEAAGQKFGEMTEEVKSGKKKYTPFQMALAPLVSGASTGVLSAVPTAQTLRNTARVWKSAEKEAGKEFLNEATKSVSREILKDMGREVATEELDNLVQNVVKRDVQGDKSVGYFDNAYKVLKDTALLTGMLTSPRLPHVAMEGLKKFTKPSDVKILEENGNAIIELTKQLDNPNLTPENRKLVESQIKSLTKESGKIVNETVKKLDGLEESEIKQVLKDEKIIEDIKSQVESIKSDESMSDSAKKVLLNGLKEKYEDANARINEKLDEPIKKATPVEEIKTPENETVQVDDIAVDGNVQPGNIGNTPQGTNTEEIAAVDDGAGKGDPVEKTEDVASGFKKSVDLFNDIKQIQEMYDEGRATKNELRDAKKRRTEFLKDNPTIKYIDDNIRSITSQLEEKGELTKKGDCP